MKRIFGLAVALAALGLGMNAVAGSFTAGNIVIYRMGDGTQPLTNIGNTVFLDEYTPAEIASGCVFCPALVPVQSIQMPTNWVGNQAPLIASGQASDEGQMSLSKDGRYLILTGFGATIGQLTNLTTYAFPALSSNADLTGSYATNAVTEADVPRVIGLVDGSGHIYTSTTITNSDEEADEIRSSASLEGTNIWYGGGDGKVVKYAIRGSLTATQVCANTGFEPMRSVNIFGKTVYVDKSTLFGSATNTFSGITTNISGNVTNIFTLNPFGGAMPVVSIPTNFVGITSIGSNSAQGFVMFNLANANIQNGVTNADTLYLADSAVNFPGESRNYGGALLKYIYTNSAWVFEGSIGGEDAYGVTGVEINPTNITLYFTEDTNAVMYSYTDTTGYGGNPPYIGESSAVILNNGSSLINVRGIAVVPQGGDSGTLTGGQGITIGPPYGPYFRGPQGGPFTPSNGVTYSVANLSSSAGSFTFHTSGTSFLTITPSSGSLAPGASTTVTMTTSANATNLNGGQSYTATIALHSGGIGGPIVDTIPTATLVVDALYLSPTTNFISLGEPGGPFTPPSTVYVLSNATPKVLGYSAFTSNSWTSLSAPSAFQVTGNSITGTVAGFSTANITVSLNSGANSLGIGTYDDQLIVTNASAGTALTTQPDIYLQIGFGVFDDFTTFAPGNVVGQNNWNGSATAINPVQIMTIVDGTNCVGCLGGTNEYVVPGGCANANGTSQQPYKYVAAGPVTNAFNIVGTVTNNVPTYAVTGVLITFTNAPTASNYIFEQGNKFVPWNDAGIIQNGSGYSWTTELDQYQTGGGPEGTAVYNFGQQYQVFFVTDFVESNAYVFVNPPGPSVDPTAVALVNDAGVQATNLAVYSNGEGADPCPGEDCVGNSAQAWESITLGQYSSDCVNGLQPGYFVTRIAASTNYADVWNWLNPGAVTPPSDPFTSWQDYYFTPSELANASFSGPNADPFGKGVSNTNQFLTGFNPTNSAAYLHIISVVKSGNNSIITYLGANGDDSYMPGFASRTNVLDFTTGTANGSYSSNNFASTGQTNILSGGDGLGIVTNFVDVGGATNKPARYYRVRVPLP
jgi:hypothetical protein